jgi:hypothetical protein
VSIIDLEESTFKLSTTLIDVESEIDGASVEVELHADNATANTNNNFFIFNFYF